MTNQPNPISTYDQVTQPQQQNTQSNHNREPSPKPRQQITVPVQHQIQRQNNQPKQHQRKPLASPDHSRLNKNHQERTINRNSTRRYQLSCSTHTERRRPKSRPSKQEYPTTAANHSNINLLNKQMTRVTKRQNPPTQWKQQYQQQPENTNDPQTDTPARKVSQICKRTHLVITRPHCFQRNKGSLQYRQYLQLRPRVGSGHLVRTERIKRKSNTSPPGRLNRKRQHSRLHLHLNNIQRTNILNIRRCLGNRSTKNIQARKGRNSSAILNPSHDSVNPIVTRSSYQTHAPQVEINSKLKISRPGISTPRKPHSPAGSSVQAALKPFPL